MLAMQYEITLPADYDMGIVHRRVAEKGRLMDEFPGLAMKAYLVRERGAAGSPVNQYAPFYLWNTVAGMNAFLWGAGFRGLSQDFGRPVVRSWLGLAHRRGPRFDATPATAVRRLQPIPADGDPAELIERSLSTLSTHAELPGVHSAAVAIDTTRWELVTLTLGTDEVTGQLPGEQYRVHHLSMPELTELPQGRHW
ncbi:DUF4865 family protein [Kitasatospora sp. RB6PN24]|uniref:DUF4865 family protein n=1 Tax=Kitasatospora humi TaxID=2893891 RepID=UPI001E456A49|nr:DUF4865 family protein [Kitasatospora humi]MCC9305529.1 DUF4865 family protein [Kitasatospora humi]